MGQAAIEGRGSFCSSPGGASALHGPAALAGQVLPRGSLGGRLAEDAPGVEAAGEGMGLVAFPHQAQLPGVLGRLRAHVLDVHLKGGWGGFRHWPPKASSCSVPIAGTGRRPRGARATGFTAGGFSSSSLPLCQQGPNSIPRGRWRHCPSGSQGKGQMLQHFKGKGLSCWSHPPGTMCQGSKIPLPPRGALRACLPSPLLAPWLSFRAREALRDAPGQSPALGPALTWQAFKLSLISTWLVWVPTHM